MILARSIEKDTDMAVHTSTVTGPLWVDPRKGPGQQRDAAGGLALSLRGLGHTGDSPPEEDSPNMLSKAKAG